MLWIRAKTVEGWDCIVNAQDVFCFCKPSPLQTNLPISARTLAIKNPGMPPLLLDVLYEDIVAVFMGDPAEEAPAAGGIIQQ